MGENFLGVFRVLPEARAGYLYFKGGEFDTTLGDVKESSVVRPPDA
jgi:hypothetical protein